MTFLISSTYISSYQSNLLFSIKFTCIFVHRTISAAEVWNEREEEDLSSVFGHFPVNELSLLSNVVDKRIQESEELTGLLKSATNGFKLYLKTRQPASNASMKRARQFPDESLHPLFLKMNQNSNTSSRLKVCSSMTGFN